MKKWTALLFGVMFSLSAAMPVSAAPADDSLAMVPASELAPAKKHKRSAGHIKKAKHKHTKVRLHKRSRRH